MKLHKEGIKTIRKEIIILLILNYLAQTYLYGVTSMIIFTASLLTLLMSIYFFRVPKRIFERKNGFIYAPCDGKIVVIEETKETEYYQDNKIQVSIFMSPLNIHNNVYPISGTVTYTKYHPGKFLFAWNPKASTDNERNSVVIENKKISILFRQIAGALARRIVSYSKINEQIETASECGFIKFGSRVDIFIPIETEINIKLNEKVIAGKSIIATY